MACRKCGSENIEKVTRPDSLRCLYPNEQFIDRCVDCGDITSRMVADLLEALMEVDFDKYGESEGGGGEEAP